MKSAGLRNEVQQASMSERLRVGGIPAKAEFSSCFGARFPEAERKGNVCDMTIREGHAELRSAGHAQLPATLFPSITLICDSRYNT